MSTTRSRRTGIPPAGSASVRAKTDPSVPAGVTVKINKKVEVEINNKMVNGEFEKLVISVDEDGDIHIFNDTRVYSAYVNLVNLDGLIYALQQIKESLN